VIKVFNTAYKAVGLTYFKDKQGASSYDAPVHLEMVIVTDKSSGFISMYIDLQYLSETCAPPANEGDFSFFLIDYEDRLCVLDIKNASYDKERTNTASSSQTHNASWSLSDDTVNVYTDKVPIYSYEGVTENLEF
jgi:hypothetical protein